MAWPAKLLVYTVAMLVVLLRTSSSETVVADKYYMGTLDECVGGSRVVSAPTGYLITPPEGMNKYYGNCVWQVTISAGGTGRNLLIHFRNFSIGIGDSYVITNVDFGGTMSITYTTNNLPPSEELEGFGEKVKIKFTADNDGDMGGGIGIFWTSTVPPETTPQPNALPPKTTYKTVLPGAEYTLTSPNYPGDYPTDTSLYWGLQAAEGDKIHVIFNDFKLSLDDSLEIYEGLTSDVDNLLVKYTGKKLGTPAPVISSSNKATVVFLSSPYVGSRGFDLTYKVYVPEKATTTAATNTKKPLKLDATGRAVLIVVSIIVLILIIIVITYFGYYKPKQKKEEQIIATEFFETDESMMIGGIPKRPMTPAEAARIQADVLMRQEAGYGTLARRPGTARPGTARPGTARPGTARPGTARPGTARPGTAAQSRIGGSTVGQLASAAALVNSGVALERPKTTMKKNMNPNAVMEMKHEVEIAYNPQASPDMSKKQLESSAIASARPGTAGARPKSAMRSSASAPTTPKITVNDDLIQSSDGNYETKWSGSVLDDDWGSTPPAGNLTRTHEDPYQKLSHPPRLAPLGTSLPPLLDIQQKTKQKRKKKKLRQMEEQELKSSSPRPKSGLRTSATAPGDLAKEEDSALPGRVGTDSDLQSSLTADDLRPTSARRGYARPADLSDDELSL